MLCVFCCMYLCVLHVLSLMARVCCDSVCVVCMLRYMVRCYCVRLPDVYALPHAYRYWFVVCVVSCLAFGVACVVHTHQGA